VWDLSRNISDQADEIYRHIDSRLDKLEDRLTKNS
jgi:ribosome-associated translation inhibitor RaiA